MEDVEKRNCIISLNKLREHNNKLEEERIEKKQMQTIVLYKKEVDKTFEKIEKKYKELIQKKDLEIDLLNEKIKRYEGK